MLRSVYGFVFSLLISVSAFSQTGTIKGLIKDETTGEGIIGANVMLEGTSQGSVTDIEGNFTISKVKVGKYNLNISYISYTSKTIPGIDVYPDQSTVVNTSLKDASEELESVVVSARRATDTDISVITDLRKSDLVAVGISSQQIRMSQDRDAAQVIRRVPGVTIIGNRFVNVRGLSERYSTVLLNGIIAPSTEVDSKAFAFDLIPSSMLDRMLVYKSGSAELPGEFAGADINIFTKNNVEENSFSVSVVGGYRAGTTGKSVQLGEQRGKLDWMGIDDGTRKLPAGFPIVNLRTLTLAGPSETNALLNATKSIPNTWGTRQLNVAPDFRVNVDMSRAFRIGEKKLDNITSVSYAQSNQRLSLSNNYYNGIAPRYLYNDERFTQTARIGAISNFTFTISPTHRLEFRNFYNQQGQNQSTFRTGTSNGEGYDVINTSYNYSSRSIYSGQLSGKHSFTDAVSFNWILGYNNTIANQPNYQRIRTQRVSGTNDPFALNIAPGASTYDAGRFDSRLNEQTYSATGNLEIKLNPEADEERQSKLTAGFYTEQKDRDFNARWVSYKWRSADVIDNSLLTKPITDIFVPENLGSKFILEEGTNEGPDLYDKYEGHNRLLAGYVGFVTPIADKFRLSTGLRVENNVQQIDVRSTSGFRKRVTNSPLTVLMPFANLSYNFSEKMLLRIAYSKTVNRPVFRELAPFNFYDFERNANIVGNPNLVTARIDNVDLRWELYPSKSENISVGVFYKYFKDPIEQYIYPGGNLIYSFFNAPQATNYGVEIELRKSLENLSIPFINKLSIVANGALIQSMVKIDVTQKTLDNLAANRPLQGQSPYVANASINYNSAEQGLQVSAQYNVFGKRIYAVGDKSDNPNQYEMPRNQIDLTISKQLSRNFELKLGIQDILNQPYRLMADNDFNNKITGADLPIQVYRFGQYATIGVTWRLN